MKLLQAIDAINVGLGRFVSFLLWVGIVVLCYEVVARYIFEQPTLWAHSYTQRIFGSYFVLVGAYTLRANKSETIEWLKFTLEGVGERTHGYAFEDTAF